MQRRLVLILAGIVQILTISTLRASGQMSMPGVENSVGYLSSGTSIQPAVASESSPMIHRTFGGWTAMFHANAFLAGVQQSGPRGGDKLFSANWFMPMVVRQSGPHSVTLKMMLSLEPATITRRRYPLLFQTGEMAYGLSIIDGQHPHDFIMELAGRYDFALGERSQFFVYGGPVGEAALGPAAFPHRSSASENPLSPLGHHQEDSTHIAVNVIALGVSTGPVQIEASTFHGREPNENRWNFDRGKPDSFSARATFAPSKNLSGQVSTARINSPETDPDLDTVRTTASLHHTVSFSSGHSSTSLIWGRNKNLKNGTRRIFNSYTFEATSKFLRRNWLWTRIENVDRDRSLLPVTTPQEPECRLCGVLISGASLPGESTVPVAFDHVVLGPDGVPTTIEEDPIGRVQAYTIGYERELPSGLSWLNAGVGFQATVYGMPSELRPLYGTRPATFAIFLKLRPAGNMSEHMRMMHQGR
jgi:hypothetical protein